MIRIEENSVHIEGKNNSVRIGSNCIIQNSTIGYSAVDEIIVTGNEVYVNGVKMPPCPGKGHNSTIIDGRIFLNGYELIGNKWKRTLRALWHIWF